MRKLLYILGLYLAAVLVAPAENLTLTDGSAMAGDIVKVDDNGLLLHTPGNVYTNLPWGRFSQESLKQLGANPKLRQLVEPFIEPDISKRAAKAEVRINEVKRLERPDNPSIFGGLMHSPVTLVMLLVLYLANLYAAFEVSIIRARSALQVVGLAAVVPVVIPIVFLAMPIKMEPEIEETEEVAATEESEKPREEAQVVDASWKEEKKAEPVIFARGKYTFNKRFVETKFAGFIGEPKGDALKFTMHLKTSHGELTVIRIKEVGPTAVMFETVERGAVPVPLVEISEIKLNPKTA